MIGNRFCLGLKIIIIIIIIIVIIIIILFTLMGTLFGFWPSWNIMELIVKIGDKYIEVPMCKKYTFVIGK